MKLIYIRTTILFAITLCLLFQGNAQIQGSSSPNLHTVQIKSLKIESKNGNVGLTWKSESEENIMQYEVERSTDGRYYSNLGFIPARNSINGDFYEFENQVTYTDSAWYRLKVVDRDNRISYSQPVVYRVNNTTSFAVYPNIVTTRVLNIFLKDPFTSLQVVSINGAVMLRQNLSGKTGRINIPLSPNLSEGTYVVEVSNNERRITQKFIVQ